MKRMIILSPIVVLSVSCTTLDQSFKLGAATGALAGAAATYGAEKSIGRQPTLEDVGVGASIGLGLGLLTSYFVHQSVIEDREDMTRQIEVHFGDLPPSPFIMPPLPKKNGGRK